MNPTLVLIGLVLVLWIMISPRLWSLTFPFWYAFFPKGFILLDNPSLPVMTMYRALCIGLFMSVMIRVIFKPSLIGRGSFPIIIPLICIMISCILSVVSTIVSNGSDPNAGPLGIFNFFNEVIVPVTAFSIYFPRQNANWQQSFFQYLLIFYGVISLYAIIAFAIDYNPYIEFLKSTNETGRIIVWTYEGTLRGLRAQGTISHPITFGGCLVLILLSSMSIASGKKRLGLNVEGKKLKNHPFRGVIAAFCIIIILAALLLTKSRSPLILLAVACPILLIFSSIPRMSIYLLVATLGAVPAFLFVPQAQEAILSVVNIFDSSAGQDQHGSSIDMRAGQMNIAEKYFFSAPILGHGLDATENIVASGEEPDLKNSESLIYSLMINQGAIGILAYAFFFIYIYAISFIYIKGRNSWAIYLGMVSGYIAFVLATGVLETFSIFCCLVSAIILRWQKHPVRRLDGDLA